MNRIACRFNKAIEQLDSIFYEASIETNEKKKEVLLSYLIIKLHDQWNTRCRQIILESYSHSVGRMTKYLRSHWGRRPMNNSWELDWHVPNNAIRAARLLDVPDLIQIQNAFGAVLYIEDIRWTRNAIVHNMPVSFAKFKTMTLSKYFMTNRQPHTLPLEINPHTGNTIYEDWCNDLSSALSYAL
jgi:hypothetical protein